MSKLEQLRAAYEAATPGKWISTGVVVAAPAEGGLDYLLQGCHADGIKNDPDIEFAALAHNMMPQLLLAVAFLKEVTQVLTTPEDFDEDARRDTRLDAGVFLESFGGDDD